MNCCLLVSGHADNLTTRSNTACMPGVTLRPTPRHHPVHCSITLSQPLSPSVESSPVDGPSALPRFRSAYPLHDHQRGEPGPTDCPGEDGQVFQPKLHSAAASAAPAGQAGLQRYGRVSGGGEGLTGDWLRDRSIRFNTWSFQTYSNGSWAVLAI